MRVRFGKIDVLIVILAVLTGVAFFTDSSAYMVLFWGFGASLLVKFFPYLKSKFLWKIRNRMFLSGIFFVITPLVLLASFFLVTIYIIVAQLGVVIVESAIDNRILGFERTATGYLSKNDKQAILEQVERYKYFSRRYKALDKSRVRDNSIVVCFEKVDGSFKNYCKYPEDLDITNLRILDFSGHFKLDNKFYIGSLRQNDNMAILVGMEVNQKYLDELSTIIDYFSINDVSYTGQFNVVNPREMLTNVESDSEENNFPWAYPYMFLDFDSQNDEIVERKHTYLLKINFDKLMKMLKGFEPGSLKVRFDTRKIIYGLVVFFGIFIIASFGIGFSIIRVITGAVSQLTLAIQHIRRGNFNARVRLKSKDQLQYLGESFNEMASGIDRLLMEEKVKQRLEEELRIARSIQLRLLPEEQFSSEKCEISAANIPATEIAGDYFDYFSDEDSESISVLVADVSGHGASAAFYMAEMKGIINYLQRYDYSPARMIVECHESIMGSIDRSTFITMNVARFDFRQKVFRFARAGHTKGLFFCNSRMEIVELFPQGMAIGMTNFISRKIEEVEVPFQSGDILFLFSDGLSEVMNEEGELLGTDNLKKILIDNRNESVETIKAKLLDFSIKFGNSKENEDDLTFIILKVK